MNTPTAIYIMFLCPTANENMMVSDKHIGECIAHTSVSSDIPQLDADASLQCRPNSLSHHSRAIPCNTTTLTTKLMSSCKIAQTGLKHRSIVTKHESFVSLLSSQCIISCTSIPRSVTCGVNIHHRIQCQRIALTVDS